MDVVEDVKQFDCGICASFTDETAVFDAADGCDAIIHTAAMHGASFCKATNAQFIATNVLGSENLFQAALKFDIPRLVMSSTMEVLLGRTWDAYGTALLREDMTPRPDWIYPLTKLQVEQMSEFYARVYGLETIDLRYMGFDDRPIEQLSFDLLARGLTVKDAAISNLLAATTPGLKNEILHIGPDTVLTQDDTNQALRGDTWSVLERHWPGSEMLLKQKDLQPHTNHFWPVVPVDRAKNILNWKPESKFDVFLHSLGWSE
jgi:UDP-glucose 4-epimerase